MTKNNAFCHMIQRYRKCRRANSIYWECAPRLIVRICIRRLMTKPRFASIFCVVFVQKPKRLGNLFQNGSFKRIPRYVMPLLVLFFYFFFENVFFDIFFFHYSSARSVMSSYVRSNKVKEAAS